MKTISIQKTLFSMYKTSRNQQKKAPRNNEFRKSWDRRQQAKSVLFIHSNNKQLETFF